MAETLRRKPAVRTDAPRSNGRLEPDSNPVLSLVYTLLGSLRSDLIARYVRGASCGCLDNSVHTCALVG